MSGALALLRHAFADWRQDNAGRLGGAEVTQAYAHRHGSRQERQALVPEPA